MYCITDEQVDYILSDLRRHGVETEDLQLNLLDHICCIVEQNLGAGEDFEDFYHRTAQRFYVRDFREIEDETQLLLTFKNYYVMRKITTISGAAAAAAFILGSLFKLMYWPGAAFFFFLGILLVSFVVLPLMLVLKTREKSDSRDKLVFALGTVTGILYCLSTLFALQHWEGRTALWLTTIGVSMFLFIPAYFFTGIRKPETRSNTILTSVLLLCATSLLFAMIALKPAPAQVQVIPHPNVNGVQVATADPIR